VEPDAAAPATGEPLKLLVGSDGAAGTRDALAFADALGARTAVQLIVFSGLDATGLKALAEKEGADMIAIGRNGEGVLDGAPCPVAVAPPGLADRDASIERVAVGYDGSQASAVALRHAAGLAERIDASLLILGAVEISLGLAGLETRQPKDFQLSQMERHLQRALASVSSTVPTETRLLLGPAHRALIEDAGEVDLLVLGSRGSYAPVRRVALGGVAAEVLSRAPWPTLVTPDDWPPAHGA
jgi:nucleotide-binding universal stress UspA family protein